LTPHVGTVDEDGRFVPDAPEAYYGELRRRKGRRTVATFKDHRRKRSNPQNRYWWGVIVRMFGAEMGCTPEEAHEVLKIEVNSEIKVIGERVVRIPHSTADLDTEEFNDRIAKAQRLYTEMFGGFIPDPGSAAAEEMMDDKLMA
jgi:hypothetical protein